MVGSVLPSRNKLSGCSDTTAPNLEIHFIALFSSYYFHSLSPMLSAWLIWTRLEPFCYIMPYLGIQDVLLSLLLHLPSGMKSPIWELPSWQHSSGPWRHVSSPMVGLRRSEYPVSFVVGQIHNLLLHLVFTHLYCWFCFELLLYFVFITIILWTIQSFGVGQCLNWMNKTKLY